MRKILVAVTAAVLLAACGKKAEPVKAKPPVPVSLAEAVTKTVPVQLRAVGTVEASEGVTVRAQVNGPVTAVHFAEGQEVGKGALLFSIDSRQYEADLKRAEANLARNLAQARNAQQDYERYAKLLKEGIVTNEQVEQYRTKAESSTADAAADRAAVENARVQLSYCSIRSPISGRTGSVLVQRGNLVKANDTAMVTVNRLSPVLVTFSLPERQLGEIRSRIASGKVRVEAYPEEGKQPETGTVTFMDNAVDPATGTIKLKGAFPNTAKRLWPGQFAPVVLTLASVPDAVTVPSAAVQTGQQGQYLFVAKPDGTADMRPVVTGVTHGPDTVIVKGVAAGEKVVSEGQMRLFPGAKLQTKQAEPPKVPGAAEKK
ncbi:MAG TPA: efflux RND transporter periplasmic adaptor subunit [Verrucomicrobiae bacterium]|nr:efflux RND transporter periplasmic adaptor subunit [Verrucomicrobiae bacterium]